MMFLPQVTKVERNVFAFPWPHENNISTLLVNNPEKPLFLLVNLLIMATRLQLNIKGTEEMLLIHQSEHFPRPNHNILVLSLFVKSYHTSHCAKCKYSNDYFRKFLVMTG